MKFKGWLSAAFALVVWGATFANTRALLLDFSPLEIQIVRFAMAWWRCGGWNGPPGGQPYRCDAACAGRKPYRWEERRG